MHYNNRDCHLRCPVCSILEAEASAYSTRVLCSGYTVETLSQNTTKQKDKSLSQVCSFIEKHTLNRKLQKSNQNHQRTVINDFKLHSEPGDYFEHIIAISAALFYREKKNSNAQQVKTFAQDGVLEEKVCLSKIPASPLQGGASLTGVHKTGHRYSSPTRN